MLSAGLGGAVSGGVFGAFGVGKNNYNVARDNRIAERARAAAATAASAEGNSVTGAGDVAADGATTPARGATPPTEGNGTGEFAPYDDNDGFGTPEFGGYDADTIREWLIEDEVEDAPDIETAARIISTVARGQLQELDDADFDVLESSPDFAEIVAGVDEAVREAAYADNREQIADNRYGEDGGERFGVAASDSGTQGQGAAQGQGAINRAPAGGNVGANGKRELAAVRTQYGESSAEASAAAEIYTRGYMSVPIGKNTSQLPSRLRTAIYRAGNLDAETAKRVSARQTKRENNTGENTSPKTAQTLDRLAEITGVKINVADNLQAPEGASDAVRRSGLNGWYDPATRTINLNSSILDTDAAILTTAMHEVTHDLQQSDAAFHAELSGAVRELMGGRAFNAALNALPAAYRDMSAETREAEVVANYLQEQFGNEQSVSRMMSEKPGVVRRVLDAIRNWIADVRSRLTGTAADRATAAQLQRLEQRIGEMMRGAGENTQGGERSSIAGDAGQFEISLDNALDEIDGNITSSPARLVLLTSTTPKVLREYASARDLPITMRYDAMYLAVRESGKLDGNYHGLGDEGLKNVISALDTPQKMLRQQNGRITVITSVPVTGKNNTIAVVELAPETKTDGAYNLVVSAFGAGQRYIDSLSRKSEELYNKEKMSGNQINGLYAHPEAIGADTLNNDSVPQGADGVNTQNLGGNNPQTETQSDTAKSDDSTKNALTRENIESNLDKLPKYSIAYHGTPYTFSEFLLDHIGEGEGAQAHGWGLYFAADRETSEKYQKMLSGDNKFLVNGKPVELKDAAKRDAYTAAAKGELQGYIDDNVAIANEYAAKGDEQNRNKYLGRAEQGRSLLGKTVIQRNAGNVYTVDIPDEDVMLNENLSLVKQPKEVRTALKRAGITARMVKEALGDYDSGRELYGALSGEDGSALGSMEIAPFVRESSEELSRWLNDIGIKGIVYDGQRDGKSYVVFDDKAIKILSDAEEALGGEVMYSLSDAEATENKRTVAAMQPVAQLTGDEFRAGGKTLATEVAAYYDKLGGSVNNPDIGEISLTRRGAKDSIAHGIGNEKATAFAAVPDVLRKGKIISAEENWKGRGYDSFLIAAPVTIAGKQYFEGVVVKATPSMGTQRFYVHEVYANEGADARSTESPEQPEVRGGTSAPTVNSVLRDLWNVKREISGGANNAPRFSLSESEYAKLDDAIATEPEYAEIRRFMRTTPISFAEGDRGDGSDYGFDSYNDMRKQYFGKLKLVNEGGETPDGIYQELQYAFGKGFFPDDITNPMDKWRRVLDVVDEAWANKEIIDSEERRLKALRAEARNTPNSSEAYNDELVSDRLAQLADLREMGIELDRDSRTNRVMTRQGENYERRIGRLKDNAKRRVSKTRRETKAKEREKYEKRNRRAQIARHAKDLSAKLLRPSDAKHVPEGLRAAVMEFLSAIELDVGTDYKIGKLKKQLEIDGGELVIDPDLQGYIEDVQADSDTSMKDMSAAQLETLWKALRGIEAAVSSANKAFALKRTDTISGVSDRLREDTAYNRKKETTDGVISAKMKQLVKLDMLTPETFFHMLGDAGNEMFRTLRDAQDKTTRIAAQVQKFTEKTLKQYKVDVTALEREKRSVTLGGEKVTMTTAQLMKLYALTRREQALEHIFAGGLLPSSIKEGLKARKRISTVRNITQGELAEALKTLTNEQKAYVRAMQRYQSETLGAYGNEASQEVYGYKKFTEDYYSAIRSDSREIMTSIERATRQTSVKNRGMSKPVVPHAATAVRVDSFFDDFSQSAADMATYAGQLAAEADMMRILNRKFRNPDGGVYDTTKQILDEFFGGKGSDYALKLMTDLAGGIEGAHDGTGALTRMFKSGAVGANLRVVIQQPTALIRAGDMISPKYLLEGALPRKGWEKAKKYAPIAQWKDWGYFDVGTGRSLKSVLFNADSKLEKVRSASMALAGKADAMAWGLLWNAAEMETKAKIKRGKSDLKAGTSAFYEAVAERFTEIIDHTQVVDGILQRSQIMRSGNAVTQMATAFMAEPTKKYNMFVSAL
ncbi:MAG: hypothetical protein LBJ99_02800, partial [Oscillospiraceae bacterium]|nr:hypothetical protein [Oscillospiraceae bacterium]